MMAAAKAIEDLERGAYRSRWRDGTLDLFGGIGVVLVGVSWWLGLFWLPAAFVPVLIVLWAAVRRRVVEPRIGRVTFGRERRARETGRFVGATWLGVGFLVLVMVVAWMGRGGGSGSIVPDREWVSALPVGLLAVMALTAAGMTGLARFVGYGLVLAAAGLAGVLLGWEPVTQILVGGSVVVLVGSALVVRFLSAHPARGEDAVG